MDLFEPFDGLSFSAVVKWKLWLVGPDEVFDVLLFEVMSELLELTQKCVSGLVLI